MGRKISRTFEDPAEAVNKNQGEETFGEEVVVTSGSVGAGGWGEVNYVT